MDISQVLTDAQIEQVPMGSIMPAVREHLIADAQGKAVSPARHHVSFENGQIVFTIGGSQSLAGFRAYETFSSPDRSGEDQIVAVWDRENCRLKGIAIGSRLGELRTGALGGIAIDVLASRTAGICGVIGAGKQAETQVLAATTVRQFEAVRVFSRDPVSRAAFADKMSAAAAANVMPVATARDCVEGADVVILATNSKAPVIAADWILPTAHVTTLGPKARQGHELPMELAARAAVIASDSPQQIAAHGAQHMLHGTRDWDRIVHLGDLAPAFDPDAARGMTLYLSAGLAGSEVAALDAALGEPGAAV